MSIFDSALRTIVNSQIGIDITYSPPNGPEVTLRGLSATPDVTSELGAHVGKMRQQKSVFEILVADLASPATGDTFTTGGSTYRVMSVWHKDQDRLVWLIEAAVQ